MALEWWLGYGSTEVANSARLEAYLQSIGSPLDSTTVCGCETFDAVLVGAPGPYTTPAEDGAPWYDPNVVESADFAGLMVLSVDGLDDHPVERGVTRSAAGSAALGPARELPRTVTVTAVLLGATCCAVAYGLRWLASALEGCTGLRCRCVGRGCGSASLTLYNCCPAEFEDPEVFAANHRRTLRRTALVEGPRVIARAGTGCGGSGGCSAGGELLTVEFVLTAATPWLWTDPVPVVEIPVPADDGTECIVWCVHRNPLAPVDPVCMELGETCAPGAVSVEMSEAACGGSVVWPDRDELDLPCDLTCRLAVCPDMDALCGDPTCRIPTPPIAPPPETCYCDAIAVTAEYLDLDLSGRPAWFGAAPLITVEAGSQDLRRLTVTFFARRPEDEALTCEAIAQRDRCAPHSVYHVAYVPAGGTLLLDGQVGRAVVECAGQVEGSPDAYGRGGGPLAFPLLDCDRYCVMVEADAIFMPAEDAMLRIAVSGREY